MPTESNAVLRFPFATALTSCALHVCSAVGMPSIVAFSKRSSRSSARSGVGEVRRRARCMHAPPGSGARWREAQTARVLATRLRVGRLRRLPACATPLRASTALKSCHLCLLLTGFASPALRQATSRRARSRAAPLGCTALWRTRGVSCSIWRILVFGNGSTLGGDGGAWRSPLGELRPGLAVAVP